jgi:hypothetical protein
MKHITPKILIALLALFFTAMADSKTGPIKQIKVFPSHICFYIEPNLNEVYWFAFEKTLGKEMLAVLLSAQSLGRPVCVEYKPLSVESLPVTNPVDNSVYNYYVPSTVSFFP